MSAAKSTRSTTSPATKKGSSKALLKTKRGRSNPSGGIDIHTPRNQRLAKKVDKGQLASVLQSAITSKGSAEYAVLHLFHNYDINVDELQRVLQEKGLSVSFSKVTYNDIAPMVGLNPDAMGLDMKNFHIFRARLPTDMIHSMMEDLQVAWKQYGSPDYHINEEARSRCLSPLFNRTVALFNLTIRNTPETIIPPRFTTKGRIEYYFLIFGGLSLLVIEVKYQLGKSWERLNAVAQVIAECDACDYINGRKKFPHSMVYGILCDGDRFEFYSFDGSTTPPTFALGVVPNSRFPDEPGKALIVPTYGTTSNLQLMQSLRPVCETIFYFLLLAYTSVLDAYHHRSAKRAISDRKARASSSGWLQARNFGKEAMELAVAAAAKAASANPDALTMASDALDHLQKSVDSVPADHENINFLSSWVEDLMEYS